MIKVGNRAGPDFLKVNVTLKSGEEFTIEKEDIRGDSVQFSDASSDAGTFSIGYATMKTFTFGINNSSKQYDSYNFEGAVAVPYIINNGKNYLKGRYEVYEPKVKGRSIELVCYDSMYDTEKEYNTELTFPATLGRMMQECSIKCQFVLADNRFPNDDMVVEEKPNLKTWRQLIAYIAQCAGCYARFSVRDELELRGYDRNVFTPPDSYNGGYFDQTSARKYQSGDNLDGGDFTFSESTRYDGGTFDTHTHHNIFQFKGTEIATDDTVITGISIKIGDTEYLHGSKDYMLQISNNPLITENNVQTVLTCLVNGYIGLRFRKMTAICLSDFSVEAGDPACLWEPQGNEYHCYITNISYKLNGNMTVSNAAEVKKKNNYSSGNTVTKLLELADKEAQKRVSQYKQMQEYFNSLALNMFGMYYFTEIDADGAEIHYGSNTPNLEDSTYAWKDGSKGFFISKDGGKTWKYGRDSDGNVVANILAAVGIVSEWINTRGLKATDNKGNITFEVDAQTGAVRMNCTEFLLAGKTIGDLISAAIPSQTQKDILDILTNNGADKGIYLLKEKLYISFSAAMGGELTLGGENNGYGILRLKNKYDWDIGTFNSNGIIMRMIKSYPTTINNVSAFDFSKQVFGDLGIDFYRGRIKNGDEIESKKIGGLEIRNYISSGIEEQEVGLYAMGGTPHAVLSAKSSSGSTLSTIQARGDGVWIDPILATGCIACVTNPGSGAKINLDTTRIEVVKELKVNGNFSVTGGTKSKIVDTSNYGSRFLYCYEMPSPMFGDIGEGQTDEGGECYVYLDDIFSETIAAGVEYQVFLQKEGPGDVWVQQKSFAYFIVKGTPNLKFAWEVKAKQKGYELDRLEDNIDRGLGFYEGPESVLANERETFINEQERLLMDERQFIIEEREGVLYETA